MKKLEIDIFDKFQLITIVVFVFAFVYLILKIIEVIRLLNYGKLSKDLQQEVKECKWKKTYYIKDGIKTYTCVRPKIWLHRKKTNCKKNCKYRKFETMPQYEEMKIIKYLEQIIAIFASLYALFKIIVELISIEIS